MKTLIIAVITAGSMATTLFAQSAREIRGASPYVAIENEPAPKLIVDPPLPEGLAQGVFWAQCTDETHATRAPDSTVAGRRTPSTS
jgi:hypothetical protein